MLKPQPCEEEFFDKDKFDKTNLMESVRLEKAQIKNAKDLEKAIERNGLAEGQISDTFREGQTITASTQEPLLTNETEMVADIKDGESEE